MVDFRSAFINTGKNFKSFVRNFTYPANLSNANVYNQENGLLKAYVSNSFLYKPPYGFPRMIDVPTIRALSKSPYVYMVTSTIIDEVASIEWDIVEKDNLEPKEEESDAEVLEEENIPKINPITINHIKEVKDFFNNPNQNEESFEFILRAVLRDILELDSGVIVKVFNRIGEFKQMFARDGGCLNYNSMIETDMGFIPIGKIVKDKLKCKVKTYNFEKNEIEWKPINGYRCSGTSDVWYKIKAKTNNKFRTLTAVTHHIPTPEGKKLIEDLKVGDIVYTQQNKLNNVQKQIILGSLLGDGSLKKGSSDYAKYYFKETHSEKQKDYLLWKFENFKELNPVYREYKSAYSEDYEPTLKCQFKTRADIVFEEFVDLKYPEFKKEIFDKLDVLGLAVWLQDDGYMYPYGGIDISTHNIPKEIQKYGLEVLKQKWDIEGKLGLDKRCNKYFMKFNKENSKKIVGLIKKYIHPNMEYKFNVSGNPPIKPETELDILETEIYEVKKFYNIDSKYDIEVADNHNYFAQGILVNNTFLKNPDIYGYLGNKAEFMLFNEETDKLNKPEKKELYDTVYKADAAYFQYGWVAMMPIPFGRREIVYLMRNARSDSIYGRSPVELLTDIIQTLIYGSTFNLEYFTNNNMPDGIIQFLGANKEQLDVFRERFEQQFKKQDSWGNWRKQFHKYPITNTEVKFQPFTLKPEEMRIIEQQSWFSKLVFACFGITPSELGFTENSNKATELVQSKVFRRKAIRPLLKLLEYHINTQIMPEFGYEELEFKFNDYDLAEDLQRHQLFETQLKNGIRTANEVRQELGLLPKEGGDKLKASGGGGGFPFGNFNPEENQYNNEGNEERDKQEKLGTLGAKSKKKETKAQTIVTPLAPKENEKPDKKLKRKLIDYLRARETAILEELEKIYTSDKLAEIKDFTNLWERLIDNLKGIFSTSEMKTITDSFTKENYFKGLEITEKEFSQNFFPNQKAIDFLKDYNFDLIKNMTEELENKLKSTLQRAYMRDSNLNNIKEEVKNIFNTTESRAKSIVRTETNRAESYGKLEGASQSELVLGKSLVNSNPESDICKKMIAKYGDKTIDLNEKFNVTVNGKVIEDLSPPFHVNCKTRLITPRLTK